MIKPRERGWLGDPLESRSLTFPQRVEGGYQDGAPAGNAGFIEELERQLANKLRRGSPGRPPKARKPPSSGSVPEPPRTPPELPR